MSLSRRAPQWLRAWSESRFLQRCMFRSRLHSPFPYSPPSRSGFPLGKSILEPVPFDGQFMRLDPVAVRNIQRTYQMAAISNDQRLQMYMMAATIREEVTAVLWSLSNLRLIDIPAEHMPLAIEAVYSYACKTAGVRNGEPY